jgi:hypothetical protein
MMVMIGRALGMAITLAVGGLTGFLIMRIRLNFVKIISSVSDSSAWSLWRLGVGSGSFVKPAFDGAENVCRKNIPHHSLIIMSIITGPFFWVEFMQNMYEQDGNAIRGDQHSPLDIYFGHFRIRVTKILTSGAARIIIDGLKDHAHVYFLSWEK